MPTAVQRPSASCSNAIEQLAHREARPLAHVEGQRHPTLDGENIGHAGAQLTQGQHQGSRKNNKTTLEFNGQWHPPPNGAKTGHGVVPSNWELTQVSENDRALATYGWAGGAQLCLSNAFAESDQIRGQIDDLLGRGFDEDDIEIQCLRSLATCSEEHEAVMRKQWTDIEFQEGEQQNEELIRHLERDFATQLAATAQKLRTDTEPQREEAAKFASCERSSGSALGGCASTKPETSNRAKTWFNIKVSSGTPSGKVYLSGNLSSKQEGGDLSLSGYDDGSGRQRWLLERVVDGDDKKEKEGTVRKEGKEEEDKGEENRKTEVPEEEGLWKIKLLGGTCPSRRYLRVSACSGTSKLALGSEDDVQDGATHHLWRIIRCSAEGADGLQLYYVRPAHHYHHHHAESSNGFLASSEDGSKVFLASSDTCLGRERWVLPGFAKQCGNTAAFKDSGRPDKDAIAALARRAANGSDASLLSSLSADDMTRVMNDNRNLGVAIDLVGCYLKNYEIDKADRVCRRIMPLCRERGGLWLFKLLNFYSTVRMKQSRYQEALDMYNEYESLLHLNPEEHWELYDTIFRNLGWIHSSLNNHQKALEYFQRCVEIKGKNGVPPHWFDQWDLGKTHARISVSTGQFRALKQSLEAIEKGIALHEKVEKQDKVMRGKMLTSAGECAALLGEFGDVQERSSWNIRAVELHRRSYDLYVIALGRSKPLTGWCMEHLANSLKKLETRESLEEAKELMLQAFKVQCQQDIIKLPSVERLLASILELVALTNDLHGLSKCQDSINVGLENLRRRQVDQMEATSFAVLLRRVAQALLTFDMKSNKPAAIDLLREALRYAQQGLSKEDRSSPGDVSAPKKEMLQESLYPRAAQQEIANLDPYEVVANLERLLDEFVKVVPGEEPDNNQEVELIDPMVCKRLSSQEVIELDVRPEEDKLGAGEAATREEHNLQEVWCKHGRELFSSKMQMTDAAQSSKSGQVAHGSPTVYKDGKLWEIVD